MRPKKPGSLLELVEVAYAPSSSLDHWLSRLAQTASSVLDGNLGAVGRILRREPRETVGAYAIHGTDPAVANVLREHQAATQHREDLVSSGPPGLRQMVGDATEATLRDPYFVAVRRRFAAVGVAEMVHLTTYDGGYCVSLGLLLGERAPTIDRRRPWSMAAVHLGAAHRLQRRALDLLAGTIEDAAILSPDGRVVHADGRARAPEARALLRDTVRRVDAARASSRSITADRALEVWRGLVDGTWSLVDRHDHDGRRYVVAVPNEVTPLDPRGLSRREAQVAALAAEGYSDKWIGYALGLSRTTVGTHLQAAMHKLGLPSRVALARAFRAITAGES